MHRSTAAYAAIFAATGMGWFSTADAASERVIYNLPANSYAFDRVFEDSHGALYATSYSAGGYGSVFQLAKTVNGVWQETTLSQFQGGADGQNPIGGVTEDSGNTLFGTTTFGGAHGAGTLYSLPIGGGRTVLYSFTGGADGNEPESTLLRDKTTGTFYGTTASGGSAGCGTAFQIAQFGGSWVETTIYSFTGADGCSPERSLHFGRQRGTIYGTARRGGAANAGTIFTLKQRNGVWKQLVIYNFLGGSDGSQPTDMTVDLDDSIYGVTEGGGALRHGTVFHLTQLDRTWNEAVIYNFKGGADGSKPIGLHEDQDAGVLYGTTEKGGVFKQGTVFSLTSNGASWNEAILHSFGASNDGAQPRARITQDNKRGVLYGTTAYGGQFGGGTIYAITP
jgi:uncharacterized repeat protein (TIGR03803 family)